jgi:hypothetical protein
MAGNEDKAVDSNDQLEAVIAESGDPILKFFRYKHLPEKLQAVSALFAAVAYQLATTQARTPERTVCFRKLLEAKDAAVRNALES